MDDATKKEALEMFQRLIRFDTTNPPGNETRAAEFLKELFDREDIPCEILESEPCRGNFVAQLKGKSAEPSLLLFSHLDVVPATDIHSWKFPPFSGTIEDGWIYGRGAVDTKYLTAAEAMAIILLNRSNIKLNGVLKLAAVADEERGGNYGTGWLLKEHPDKIRADYAINEGGGFVVKSRAGPLYLVEAEEKGICWIRLTARGAAGHASVPELGESAVERMCQALANIARHQPKPKPSPTLKRMLYALMERESGFRGKLTAMVFLNTRFRKLILDSIRKRTPELAAALGALMQITIAETMIKGGVKENIIPDHCEAIIDCRLPYGLTKDELFSEIRKAIGPTEGFQFETIQYFPASTSATDGPFYAAVRKTLKSVVGQNVETAPFVFTATTDSRYLRQLGAIAYGFGPTSPDVDYGQLIKLIHGIDERINVESLYTCTEFLVELCKNTLSCVQ
jgi:acetylornithine deacetylase/succinyl-diaminopimelate desuccinylase-like protein